MAGPELVAAKRAVKPELFGCYPSPHMPPDEGCATVEMKVNYTAPGNLGTLTGTGAVIDMGRRIAVARADIHGADGRLVATSQGTFMRFQAGVA